MLEETTLGSNLSRKATLLIGEVLEIANKVLPLGVAAKLQVCIPLPIRRCSEIDMYHAIDYAADIRLICELYGGGAPYHRNHCPSRYR